MFQIKFKPLLSSTFSLLNDVFGYRDRSFSLIFFRKFVRMGMFVNGLT